MIPWCLPLLEAVRFLGFHVVDELADTFMLSGVVLRNKLMKTRIDQLLNSLCPTPFLPKYPSTRPSLSNSVTGEDCSIAFILMVTP